MVCLEVPLHRQPKVALGSVWVVLVPHLRRVLVGTIPVTPLLHVVVPAGSRGSREGANLCSVSSESWVSGCLLSL